MSLTESPEELRARADQLVANALQQALVGIFCPGLRREGRAKVKKARKEADKLIARAREIEADHQNNESVDG